MIYLKWCAFKNGLKHLEIDMKFRIEKESDHKAIEDVTYKAFENHPHHAPGAKPTEHKIIERLREISLNSL